MKNYAAILVTLLTFVLFAACGTHSQQQIKMPALEVNASKVQSASTPFFESIEGSLVKIAENFFHKIEAQKALITEVSFINANTKEETTLSIGLDGSLSEPEQNKANEFFRCRRTNKKHDISRELLAKLADLARRFDGRQISLISGYRAAPFSSRTSRHRHGLAADIRIEGIGTQKVRDYLWLRHGEEVGVGYYKQQQFIHLDHRPGHKPTSWTQYREDGENKYNPKWAKKLTKLKHKIESKMQETI